MAAKTICIIGGNGLMGQLFCRLFTSLGHSLRQLGSQDWPQAAELVSDCDLVIVSVPINLTAATIQQISPLLPANCILADFTSIKVDPLLAMLTHHSGPVLGLHPMFGPTITTTKAQVIVYCDGRQPAACRWLLTDLANLGFTLKQLSASQHDQAMSFIQGVEHFITFSLGTFLHHKQQTPQQLLEIASPIYLAKLLLLGRIFDQDPRLYADIICADQGRLQLIQEFANWLSLWASKLQQGAKEEFIAEFSQASQWMGEFTAYAQTVSDNFLNIDLDPLVTKTSEGESP